MPRVDAQVVLYVAAVLATAGCGSIAHEASLGEQIAAVRAGHDDEITIAARPVDDRDLKLLADLSTLRTLRLDHAGNRITDAGMAQLAGLANLEHLRIRGATITDDGLSNLLSLRKLQILNLPQADLTDAGLATLANLSELVQLRLGSPRITDAGLEQLEKFPALRRLHLIDVPVTDAGLRVFEDLPQLESLYLDGARASDAAYERLIAARKELHLHINQQHHDRDPQRHGHAP